MNKWSSISRPRFSFKCSKRACRSWARTRNWSRRAISRECIHRLRPTIAVRISIRLNTHLRCWLWVAMRVTPPKPWIWIRHSSTIHLARSFWSGAEKGSKIISITFGIRQLEIQSSLCLMISKRRPGKCAKLRLSWYRAWKLSRIKCTRCFGPQMQVRSTCWTSWKSMAFRTRTRRQNLTRNCITCKSTSIEGKSTHLS